MTIDARTPSTSSKSAAVIKLLSRTKGATSAEMITATDCSRTASAPFWPACARRAKCSHEKPVRAARPPTGWRVALALHW